ncbi:hypothetical protein [Streptomyces capoamus]|nr:hypothetical protein [Streptomyces capoamus]
MIAVVAYVLLVTATSAVTLAHWLYPPWRPAPTDQTRKDQPT